MTKYQGPHIPSDAAKQVATIDQLMHQAQKLKAEVARLEGECDAARKAARAWKRAAKVNRSAFNSTCKALDDLKMNYAVLTMQTGAK